MTRDAGPMATNVRNMLQAAGGFAEVHLVTVRQLDARLTAYLADGIGVRLHYLDKPAGQSPIAYMMTKHRVGKLIDELQPDLVHVHGTWDSTAAMMEKAARKRAIVTIVSPHRALSQALIGIDFWKKKLPRLVAYQWSMVRRSTAVVAVCDEERDELLTLHMKKRIEVMPTLVGGIEEGQNGYANALRAAYTKAMDSSYRNYITDDECRFVQEMVKTVVCDEYTPKQLPDLASLSFRRIYFYAWDEDVLQMVADGIDKLRLPAPAPFDVEAVVRYKSRKAKKRGSLLETVNVNSTLKLDAKDEDEASAVRKLLAARKLGFERLTLRNMVEVYQLFRHADFDEDKVGAEMRRLNARKFVLRMQKVLHETYGLTVGYDIY